jgi:uncharacterized membrane protein YccC
VQRATTSLDIGGLSLDGFREQCMSILRDGVNSARLAGASAFYADLSWMWTVVNRISCELLERRIQCKVENEMRPLLSLIARLEQKVRHSRFETEILEVTGYKSHTEREREREGLRERLRERERERERSCIHNLQETLTKRQHVSFSCTHTLSQDTHTHTHTRSFCKNK